MKKYLPEGKIFNSPENRYYLQSERTMAEAMAQGLILEGHAVLCDSEHNIIVELPFGKGIIPLFTKRAKSYAGCQGVLHRKSALNDI